MNPLWPSEQEIAALKQNGGTGGGGGGGGPTGGNSAGSPMLTSPTAPFDPLAALYARMPQQAQFQPFMPGQQNAIAQQLSQGYGAPAQDYMAQMNQIYRPMNLTQMSEPLTTSMRAWGLQHSGQPGVAKEMQDGFNPQGYQQWGQSTGSPWLDAMFGLNAAAGVPGQGGAVDPKKKKKNVPGTAPLNPGYPSVWGGGTSGWQTMDSRDRSRYGGGLF